MLALMNSVAPISALVLPEAASRATVSSWGVSPRLCGSAADSA